MKHSTIAKTLTIAAVTALGLVITPTAKADDKGCSNASLKGTFAQMGTGTITAPPSMAGPLANVGVLTFDGNGGIIGSLVNSINGATVPATETGTYKVNADCTGSYTVQLSLGFPANAFFVVTDGGNEIQIIITDPGAVITCVAKRLYPGRAI